MIPKSFASSKEALKIIISTWFMLIKLMIIEEVLTC